MTWIGALVRGADRVLPLVLAVSVAACGDADRLPTNVDSGSGGSVSQPVAVPAAPSFTSGSAGGIPYGVFALPKEKFGDIYNATLSVIWAKYLLGELKDIKARGGQVVLSLTGNENNYKDKDGHFSLAMWKARVDAYRGIDFSAYINDGTIIAHYLIDEPNDDTNWNGIAVPASVVEEMAAYSKLLWPKMPTVVRVDPSYLVKAKITYRYLDAAWAQYVTRKGTPQDYITRNVADAQKLGLALITGMNVRKGDTGGASFSASLIESAGTTLLADPYPCAFISWQYDQFFLERSDIRSAMASLAPKARAHVTRSCRNGAGNPPPPPANVLPTAAFTAPTCTAGVPCQFSDGSTDSDGIIASRSWSFGAGANVADANPLRTFSAAGTYPVTLTVTDNRGGSGAVTLQVTVKPVNTPPTAAFDAPTCTAGVPCAFTDGSSDGDGNIASRSWTFGPGATSTEASPGYTFAAAGTYSVTLAVTDDAGASQSISRDVMVKASNQRPTAAFSASGCTAGAPCKFTDGSSDIDGSIVTWAWTFAPGSASADANPTATFNTPGHYSVSLTVTDNAGATQDVTQDVVVAPATLPTTQPIVLTLTTTTTTDGRVIARLSWKGAAGATVDFYRDGQFRTNIANKGKAARIYTVTPPAYVYQICETGSSHCSNPVTLAVGGSSGGGGGGAGGSATITLSAKGDFLGAIPGVALTWSGVSGSSVDIYRDGALVKNTPNDGSHFNSAKLLKQTAYTFKVCQQGSTSICSNLVSARTP
jgi:PKD repeat protein/predicted RecA/RadA family phage recombinase